MLGLQTSEHGVERVGEGNGTAASVLAPEAAAEQEFLSHGLPASRAQQLGQGRVRLVGHKGDAWSLGQELMQQGRQRLPEPPIPGHIPQQLDPG